MAYKCPLQERRNGVKPLLCKGAIKRLGIPKNAPVAVLMQAYCAFQHYCPTTRRAENTDSAKKCFDSLSAQEGAD